MGVTLYQDHKIGLLYTKDTIIMKRFIEEVGLDDGTSKGKFTPSEAKTLIKDENG